MLTYIQCPCCDVKIYLSRTWGAENMNDAPTLIYNILKYRIPNIISCIYTKFSMYYYSSVL